MLKLTYTETSFYLECLSQLLEEWVAQRVILALRICQNLHVEPTTASFLLPADLPGVEVLHNQLKRDDREIVALSVCDPEYLEVTLQGFWVSSRSEDVIGVFVTAMSDRTELFLHKLWQEAQKSASILTE
ncbi:MAG: hypothetical protein PUP92_40010 [Rhizonema sp. PD38]|nr:hypothetical protein [Rhizonema sp. PD38]